MKRISQRTQDPSARSIRGRIVQLLLIPLLSLVLLWGYAALVIGENALSQRQFSDESRQLIGALEPIQVGLTQERIVSVVHLSAPQAPRARLDAERVKTDAAVRRFRTLAAGYQRPFGLTEEFDGRLAGVTRLLEGLPVLREPIDRRAVSRLDALRSYTPIFDALRSLSENWMAFDDRELVKTTLGIVEGARAMDLIGQEVALVTGALLTKGRMTEQERGAFTALVAGQRQFWTLQRSLLPERDYAAYLRGMFSSPAYLRFKEMEDRIVAAPNGRIPVAGAEWEAAVGPVMDGLHKAHLRAGFAVGERGNGFGDRNMRRLALVGGAGLIAILVSLLLSVRFGRGIVRELVGLRDAARRLATERLPEVVARLSRGQPADAGPQEPVPTQGVTSEVREVAEAFVAVQRTAIEAATGQAELREGTRAVFLNIARRNQSLLHRQLSMLDALESRAEPDDLEELFALDHLTTRMRRHAESLIILSGAVPGRGWRRPVRIIDVVRGAVAEVERYTRISVVRASEDALVGTVVTDVIHLLAELLENATGFSPPDTEVVVNADRVGAGYAIDIEDRGLGMTQPEMDAVNRRLAAPPEFDLLADTDRLGLFVVARLAARHGIEVSLRRSPYGGTTAVVLIPSALIVDESDLGPADGAPGPYPVEAAVPRPGRHGRAGPLVPSLTALPPADDGAHARTAVPPDPVREPSGPMHIPENGGTHAGLPKRVRQKSIAPQLRDESPGTTGPSPGPARGPRPPEEARSLVSSLQDGWRRGRMAPAPGEIVFDVSGMPPAAPPEPEDRP